MHYLSITARLELSKNDVIEPGEYLVEDVNGAQLLLLANGGEMKPLNQSRPFDEKTDWNGKKILFVRVGGFGDVILLTPVLREVKRRWPDAIVHVSCMSAYAPVLNNLPFVDKTIGFPIKRSVAEDYDAWVFFEKAIEHNPRASEIHMTDLFAEITGLSDVKDKRPAFQLTSNEMIWVLEAYPRVDGTRRLCVQVAAGASCRTYPPEQTERVINAFAQKGWEIFLLDEAGRLKMGEKENVRNLSHSRLTFRQSAAVISGSDCLLAPDSALLHVAGALGVPAVGLYGPFPWKLRTAYCPTTHALEGSGPCAPCFHHVHLQNYFPKNGPCYKTGRCEVLAGIKPERIVQKVEQVAKKFNLVPL